MFLPFNLTTHIRGVDRGRGALGGTEPLPPGILADQVTFFQTRGADYAPHTTSSPPPPPFKKLSTRLAKEGPTV